MYAVYLKRKMYSDSKIMFPSDDACLKPSTDEKNWSVLLLGFLLKINLLKFTACRHTIYQSLEISLVLPPALVCKKASTLFL